MHATWMKRVVSAAVLRCCLRTCQLQFVLRATSELFQVRELCCWLTYICRMWLPFLLHHIHHSTHHNFRLKPAIMFSGSQPPQQLLTGGWCCLRQITAGVGGELVLHYQLCVEKWWRSQFHVILVPSNKLTLLDSELVCLSLAYL